MTREELQHYVALCRSRLDRLAGREGQVRVELRVDAVALPIRICRILGLAAAVLAVRAARHAYKGRSPGTVRIAVEQSSNEMCLSVADDGCGMPLARIADARGARIAEAGAARVGGRVAWTVSNEGTAVLVRIPVGRTPTASMREAAALAGLAIPPAGDIDALPDDCSPSSGSALPSSPRPTRRAAVAGCVVITGASSGIGRCAAGLFARHGWRVGLIARGEAGLLAARGDVEANGAVAAAVQADVTDLDALEAAAVRIEQALGPADVWVNCAGNGTYGRFLDTPAAEFRRVTDVTYLGTVNGVRVALRRMMPRDRGRIVNVCSGVAFHGMPLLSSYSGAKHAVRGFDQSLRAELAQEGSKVALVTVFPPAVNTPFFDHAVSHMGRPARPLPPVYQPEVIAEAIHLAATTGRGEMPVSFTAALFALGVRLAPGLVGRAIRRLGYDGQLVDRGASVARHAPTLFAPSCFASPVHGTFGAGARSGSVHLGILRVLARLTGQGRHGPAGVTESAREPAPATGLQAVSNRSSAG